MTHAVGIQHDTQPDHSLALKNLCDFVESDLEQVNQVLRDKMNSPISLIPQLAGHLIRAGGKRIRPILTLATARLCRYEGSRHIDLAACVEFIHTATLLHDDVVDESDKRRGQDSANAIWGNKPSVLVGDFLFSRSFELMVQDGSLEVLRILSSASSTIVQGEILQLLLTDDVNIPEEKYFEVIEAKTAALFSAATEISAVISDQKEHQEALHTYGKNLGITFQLIDDLLDYTSSSDDLGKNVGDDFREGKITLPVILAYNAGNEHEKNFWKRTLLDLDQKDGDFHTALKYMGNRQAFLQMQAKARHYANLAASALDIFEDSQIKTILQSLAYYCVERSS